MKRGQVDVELVLRGERWCRRAALFASTTRRRRVVAVLWATFFLHLGCSHEMGALERPMEDLFSCTDNHVLCTLVEEDVESEALSFMRGVAYSQVVWLRLVDMLMVLSKSIVRAGERTRYGLCQLHSTSWADSAEDENSEGEDISPSYWVAGVQKEHLFDTYHPRRAANSFVSKVVAAFTHMWDRGVTDMAREVVLEGSGQYGWSCILGKCPYHIGLDQKKAALAAFRRREITSDMSGDEELALKTPQTMPTAWHCTEYFSGLSGLYVRDNLARSYSSDTFMNGHALEEGDVLY